MTEKPTFYTSTERLLDFLKALQKHPAQPVKWHLARMQHYENGDSIVDIIAYTEVLKLVRAARLEIESIEDVDEDLHIKPIVKIEGELSKVSINHIGTDVISNVGTDNLLSLRYIVGLLKSGYELRIPEEDLSSLLDKTNELIKDITDIDVPTYLKDLLIEHLYSLQRAINAYKISGAKGLKKAVEQGVGAIILVAEQVKQEIGDDPQKPAWKEVKRFYSLMMEGNKLLSLAYNIQKTYQLVDNLFGPNLLSGD